VRIVLIGLNAGLKKPIWSDIYPRYSYVSTDIPHPVTWNWHIYCARAQLRKIKSLESGYINGWKFIKSAKLTASSIAKQIRDGFDGQRISIKEACCVDHALRIVDNLKPNLVVAEVELPDNQDSTVGVCGHKLGYALNNKKLNIPVILLGNCEHPDQAVRDAMLKEVISGYRLIANMTPLLWRQLIFYSLNLDDRPLFIGSSPAIQALKKELEVVIKFDMPVLILDESGTGKTILAKYIHQHSPRTKGPFVAVNCAAIPPELIELIELIESELFGHVKGSYTGADNERKGLFQTADKGVLFLDEIGDMPPLFTIPIIAGSRRRISAPRW
jgi:DNA-binding NtrC family response regulator